jgi:hypothetical protein
VLKNPYTIAVFGSVVCATFVAAVAAWLEFYQSW